MANLNLVVSQTEHAYTLVTGTSGTRNTRWVTMTADWHHGLGGHGNRLSRSGTHCSIFYYFSLFRLLLVGI